MHSTFESHKVRNLHKMLDSGQFAVPKLQRTFVWDGAKAAKLLDSIYRQMPVGGLVLWDSARKNRELLRLKSGLLPDFNQSNSRVWFLLDGQLLSLGKPILYQLSVAAEASQGWAMSH